MAKTQARALMAELIDLRNHLNHIISALDEDKDGKVRAWRNYDEPMADADEIAARWGVEVPEDDTPAPGWFQERFKTLYPPEERTE